MHATERVPRDPLHGGERVDHLAILPRCVTSLRQPPSCASNAPIGLHDVVERVTTGERQLVSMCPSCTRRMVSPMLHASTPPVLKTRFLPYISYNGSVCGPSYMAESTTTPCGRAMRPGHLEGVGAAGRLDHAVGTATVGELAHGGLHGCKIHAACVDHLIRQAALTGEGEARGVDVDRDDMSGPCRRAHIMVVRPTGRAPITATVEPGSISAMLAPQ